MVATGFGVMLSSDHNASDSASKSMSFGSTDSNEKMGSFTDSHLGNNCDILNVEETSVNAQNNSRLTDSEELVQHSGCAVNNAASNHNEIFSSCKHLNHNAPDSSRHVVDSNFTKSSNPYSVYDCLFQTTFLDIKDSVLILVDQPFDTCSIQPNFSRKINRNIMCAKRKFSLKKKVISALMTSLVFNSLQLIKNKNLNNTLRTVNNNSNGYGMLSKFQMDTYYLILEYSELLLEIDKEQGWFSLLRRSLLLVDLFLYLRRLCNTLQLIPLQEQICFSCASLMKTQDLFCKACQKKLGYLDYLITALANDASFSVYDSTLGVLILASFYHYSLKLLCDYFSQQVYSTTTTRNRSSQKKNFSQKKPIQCDVTFFSNLDSLMHVLLFNYSLDDIYSKILYIKNSTPSCKNKKSNVPESVLVSSFNRLCELRLSLAEANVSRTERTFSPNQTLSSSFHSNENEEILDKTETIEQHEIKTSIPRYIICDLILQVCDMIKNEKSVNNKVLDLTHISMCIGIILGYLTEIMMIDVTKESLLLEELLFLVLQCVTETLAYWINWMQRIAKGKQKTPCDYPPPSTSVFSVLDNVVKKFCKESTLLKKIKSSFLQQFHTDISQNAFKKHINEKDVEKNASIPVKDLKITDNDDHNISRSFWVSASASLVDDIVVKNRQTLLHTWKIHLKTLLCGSSIVKIGLHTNASALAHSLSPQVTHFASNLPVIQWTKPSYPHILYIKQKKNVSQNGKNIYDDCTCLRIVESRAILRLNFDLIDPHIIAVLKSCQSEEALATVNFSDEKDDSQKPVFLKFFSKTEDTAFNENFFLKNSGVHSNNKIYGLSSMSEILNLPNKSTTSCKTKTIFPYGLDVSSRALNSLMVKELPELLKRHEYLNFLNLMLIIQPDAFVQSTSNIFVECTIYTDSFYQNFISNDSPKSVSGVALAWLKNIVKTPQSIDSILHNDYTLNLEGLFSKSQSPLINSGKRHSNTPNRIQETKQKRSKTIETNFQTSPLHMDAILQNHILHETLKEMDSESSLFSHSENVGDTTCRLLSDQLLHSQTSDTPIKLQPNSLVLGYDTEYKKTLLNTVKEKKTFQNVAKKELNNYTEGNSINSSCGTSHSEESLNDKKQSGYLKNPFFLKNTLSKRERCYADVLHKETTNVRQELKKNVNDVFDFRRGHQDDKKCLTGNAIIKCNNIYKSMKTLPHARFWIWDVKIPIASRCSKKNCKRIEKNITQVSETIIRHETVVGKKNATFQSIIYYCGPILSGAACRRVFKRRQIIISKKLQLFQDVVKLSRVLFHDWKRALYLFDCVQKNEYDLFAWGILPVRAIHHPNLWVPLPTGFFDADSCDMSSIKNKKRISKETSIPLITRRPSYLKLPKKIVCKNKKKTNCSWLSRTLSKYLRTSSKNGHSIISQFDPKIKRRYRSSGFQKSLALNRHRLFVNFNSTQMHHDEYLPFNFSYEPFSILDFVQRQKLIKCVSIKASQENKTSLFRSPFPLLRGSKVVEIEIQQENRAFLSKMTYKTYESSCMENQLGQGFYDSRSRSTRERQPRQLSLKNSLSSKYKTKQNSIGITTERNAMASTNMKNVFSSDFVINNSQNTSMNFSKYSSNRDWLQLTYENIVGPPPKWKSSSLYRMGHLKDFFFLQPFPMIYVPATQEVEDIQMKDLEYEQSVFWSQLEIEIFLNKFLVTPKHFSRISQAITGTIVAKNLSPTNLNPFVVFSIVPGDCRVKLEAHCVDFYYRMKKFFDLKCAVEEFRENKNNTKYSLVCPPRKNLIKYQIVERLMLKLTTTYDELKQFNFNIGEKIFLKSLLFSQSTTINYQKDINLSSGVVSLQLSTKDANRVVKRCYNRTVPEDLIQLASEVCIKVLKKNTSKFDYGSATDRALLKFKENSTLLSKLYLPFLFTEFQLCLNKESCSPPVYTLRTLNSILLWHNLRSFIFGLDKHHNAFQRLPKTCLNTTKILDTPHVGYFIPRSIHGISPYQTTILLPSTAAPFPSFFSTQDIVLFDKQFPKTTLQNKQGSEETNSKEINEAHDLVINDNHLSNVRQNHNTGDNSKSNIVSTKTDKIFSSTTKRSSGTHELLALKESNNSTYPTILPSEACSPETKAWLNQLFTFLQSSKSKDLITLSEDNDESGDLSIRENVIPPSQMYSDSTNTTIFDGLSSHIGSYSKNCNAEIIDATIRIFQAAIPTKKSSETKNPVLTKHLVNFVSSILALQSKNRLSRNITDDTNFMLMKCNKKKFATSQTDQDFINSIFNLETLDDTVSTKPNKVVNDNSRSIKKRSSFLLQQSVSDVNQYPSLPDIIPHKAFQRKSSRSQTNLQSNMYTMVPNKQDVNKDKMLSNKANGVINTVNRDTSDNSNLHDSSSSRPADLSHQTKRFVLRKSWEKGTKPEITLPSCEPQLSANDISNENDNDGLSISTQSNLVQNQFKKETKQNSKMEKKNDVSHFNFPKNSSDLPTTSVSSSQCSDENISRKIKTERKLLSGITKHANIEHPIGYTVKPATSFTPSQMEDTAVNNQFYYSNCTTSLFAACNSLWPPFQPQWFSLPRNVDNNFYDAYTSALIGATTPHSISPPIVDEASIYTHQLDPNYRFETFLAAAAAMTAAAQQSTMQYFSELSDTGTKLVSNSLSHTNTTVAKHSFNKTASVSSQGTCSSLQSAFLPKNTSAESKKNSPCCSIRKETSLKTSHKSITCDSKLPYVCPEPHRRIHATASINKTSVDNNDIPGDTSTSTIVKEISLTPENSDITQPATVLTSELKENTSLYVYECNSNKTSDS